MSRPAVTTAVEAVAAELRLQILSGAPAPGQRLPEEALAARFEVARHTLRAALRALAAERLVVVSPHRGARVARLDGAELQAMFELRTALEVEAARLMADHGGLDPAAPPDGVRAAAEQLQRLCDARPADRAAVDEAHLRLHHELVAAAGSPRITAAHAALADEQRLVLLQSRPALDPQIMADRHRVLLAGLSSTGPDALREHLAEGRSFSS